MISYVESDLQTKDQIIGFSEYKNLFTVFDRDGRNISRIVV